MPDILAMILNNRPTTVPVRIPGIIFPDPNGLLPLATLISTNQAYVAERQGEDCYSLRRGDVSYFEIRSETRGRTRGSIEPNNLICIYQGGMGRGPAPYVWADRRPDSPELPVVHPRGELVDSRYPEVTENPLSFTNVLKFGGAIIGGFFGWRVARRLIGRSVAGTVVPSFLRRVGGFLLRRCVPLLAGGIVGLGIAAALFAYEIAGLYKNIQMYRDFQDLNSQVSNKAVEDLNRSMMAQGFTPTNPAQVTFVAHSGAGAVGTILAARSNSPNSGLAFRVRRLVLIASPLTRQHLENIPSDVEVVYVEARNDSMHSFARNFGWVAGLDICQDIQPYVRNNFHALQIDGDHMSSIVINRTNQEEETIKRLVYRTNFTDEQLRNISNEARLVLDGIFRPQRGELAQAPAR